MALSIPDKNLVMATERTPGVYRPGNQARMVAAEASNPFTAVTCPDAFMPGMGECRSGNGVGDLGLGGWGRFRSTNRQAVTPTAPNRGRVVPMLSGLGAPPVYTDSNGKVISKQQHDALQALAKNPTAFLSSKSGLKKVAAAAQQATPQVIVKRLPGKPVNGLGRLGEIATSPLVLGGLAIAALWFLNKSKPATARR
jgi:hypothetical protein